MNKEYCPCLRGNSGKEILLGEGRFWCTGQSALECVGLIAALPFLEVYKHSFRNVFTG